MNKKIDLVSDLVKLLNSSDIPEFHAMATNLLQEQTDLLSDARKEKMHCISVEVDTDFDFYINDSSDLSKNFFAESKAAAIAKARDYLLDDSNYNQGKCFKEKVHHFKTKYVSRMVTELTSDTAFSMGANWTLDAYYRPPKDESKSVTQLKVMGVVLLEKETVSSK